MPLRQSLWRCHGVWPPTVLVLAALGLSCTDSLQDDSSQSQPVAVATADQDFQQLRSQMVTRQLANRDIDNAQVLDVMRRVPRHKFVPTNLQRVAYDDRPQPIGHGQTISQPYIVALMTQLAQPRPGAKALDIGTGSGYQAAVLAKLVKEVYSIEIVEPLANEARRRLHSLGYRNIHVRHGDGYRGWPEQAPFDIIIVAAAPEAIPEPLIEQLAPGGKLVIPVGDWWQELTVVEKAKDGSITQRTVAAVSFVPMTGEVEKLPTAK